MVRVANKQHSKRVDPLDVKKRQMVITYINRLLSRETCRDLYKRRAMMQIRKALE